MFHTVYTPVFTVNLESDDISELSHKLSTSLITRYRIRSCATLFSWLLYVGTDMEHLNYRTHLGLKDRDHDNRCRALFIKQLS